MFDLKAALLNKARVYIHPGEQYVTRKDMVISTLLGSCVAACLYDQANRVIGMNHFLLASRKNISSEQLCSSQAGRYGVHAMELLINEMLKQGAERRNLRAKVFGGGAVLAALNQRQAEAGVGEMNIRFIRDFLQREKIPLISSCLGGSQGMLIHFFAADHSVYLRRVGKICSSHIAAEEYRYQEDLLEEFSESKRDVELWK